MNLPDFLTRDEYGEIHVTGSRIVLYHFLFDYNRGDSPEMIALSYPHIPLATIHKVIAYYLENKPEVDRYLREYGAELDRLRANGRHVDLDALRERLIRRQAGQVR